MSLLNDFARPCVQMAKTREPDGAGGYIPVWNEGEEFLCCLALDTSMEARRAQKDGVTSVYSSLVDKSVHIGYGDYFKDKASGTTYRVTSKPEEKQTPYSAGFSLKYFTAERKELPK